MAILIDMDMPTDCRDCPMETYYSSTGETVCIASWEILAYPYQTIQFNGRPDWCPLREVVRCRECKSYIKVENESEAWELCNHGMVSIHSVGGEEFCSRGERREE